MRKDGDYIWFYCGSLDNLAMENRQFAAELTTLGVPHQFVVVAGASHTWRLWRSMGQAALIVASAHLQVGGPADNQAVLSGISGNLAPHGHPAVKLR
jgi:acetyl esterase/lipase